MDEQATNQLLIAMPSDDELYDAFIIGIRDGVHEGIKNTVEKLSGYIERAKDVIKELIIVDPQQGLLLDMTVEK